MDNQILIYSTDNFRQNRKKRFANHQVAGYACQVGFSPDGKWISSGDGSGNVVFWDWKTGNIKSRLKTHSQVVIAHEWLPHETVSGPEHMCYSDPMCYFLAESVSFIVEGHHSLLGRIDQVMGTSRSFVKLLIQVLFAYRLLLHRTSKFWRMWEDDVISDDLHAVFEQ